MVCGYRQVLAGVLAGVSGAIMLLTGLVFLLLIGVAWQLLQGTASSVPRDAMWQALAQDTSRLPGFLWGWRWARRLHIGQLRDGPRRLAPASDTLWLRRSPLRRFLIILVGCTLAVAGAVQLYHTTRSQASGGQFWVAPTTPQDTALLAFTRHADRLTLANSFGDGVVLISLVRAQDKTSVGAEQVMTLAGTPPQKQIAEIAVSSLPAGKYILTVLLREGEGGSLHYALLQGGSAWVWLAVSLVGLSGGGWLALAALIILEALARWVWTDDSRNSVS